MCSGNHRRSADENLPLTDHEFVFGAPNFCALLSKLKCTTAHAGGRKARRKEYLRKYTASERGKAVMRAYDERNRPKKRAYNKMRNALKYGDIVKADACESCGAGGKLDGHHDDYSKPLEVRWLCRPCHKTWHRVNGKALNG